MPERDGEDLTNALGMGAATIAQLVAEKYFELRGDKSSDWKKMPPATRSRWEAVVEGLFFRCHQNQGSMSAQEATRAFVDGLFAPGTFEKLPPLLRPLWEALLRHTLNLITVGQPVDGAGLSREEMQAELDGALAYDWNQWLEAKLRPLLTSLEKEKKHAAV